MENSYFQNALSDFVFDMSTGDEIRRLSEQGVSIKKIKEMLDYPVPLERIRKTVFEHLIKKEIIIEADTVLGNSIKENEEYIMEINKYGRRSFRQVKKENDSHVKEIPKTIYYTCKDIKELIDYICKKVDENEEKNSFVLCDFAFDRKDERLCNSVKNEEIKEILDVRQWEYVEGLFMNQKKIYHRLNLQMREVVYILFEHKKFEGNLYFRKTNEIVYLKYKSVQI